MANSAACARKSFHFHKITGALNFYFLFFTSRNLPYTSKYNRQKEYSKFKKISKTGKTVFDLKKGNTFFSLIF